MSEEHGLKLGQGGERGRRWGLLVGELEVSTTDTGEICGMEMGETDHACPSARTVVVRPRTISGVQDVATGSVQARRLAETRTRYLRKCA